MCRAKEGCCYHTGRRPSVFCVLRDEWARSAAPCTVGHMGMELLRDECAKHVLGRKVLTM